MSRPLKVLIVEDSKNDAELLILQLEAAGYDPECRRVDTRGEMTAGLQEQKWDVIVADYVMPRFNGLEALEVVRSLGLDLPFIVVSGHITDSTAVAAMKAGAHDYVMKDNLARLGPAVERELRDAEVRRQHRRADNLLKAEHALTRLLAQAGSLQEAVPGLLTIVLETLEVEVAALWVPDPSSHTLQAFAARSRDDSPAHTEFLAATRNAKYAPGADLPGRVWRERQMRWAVELLLEPEFERRAAAKAAGLQSGAAFPVESAGECVGVLEFFSTRRLEREPAMFNMLTALGSELGQFIQRRNAQEALRRAHDELEVRVKQRTAELQATNSKLELAIAERKRLENELLEITEKERRRIGLDLHDDLGQRLSGIALMTKGLALQLEKSEADQAQAAARIHTMLQEAMTHTSDLAHDLATFDLGQQELPAALEGLAARARELFGISCRFSTHADVPPVEPQLATQLYKIAQEAVTNAIKHGKAKRVGITLTNGAENLVLTIQNNGVPFPDLRSQHTGMGLRIMNYRANVIGASLDIKAAGTRGTLVTCSLPKVVRLLNSKHQTNQPAGF